MESYLVVCYPFYLGRQPVIEISTKAIEICDFALNGADCDSCAACGKMKMRARRVEDCEILIEVS